MMSQITEAGEWFFTDHNGDVWKLEPTGDPHIPLSIKLSHRAAERKARPSLRSGTPEPEDTLIELLRLRDDILPRLILKWRRRWGAYVIACADELEAVLNTHRPVTGK